MGCVCGNLLILVGSLCVVCCVLFDDDCLSFAVFCFVCSLFFGIWLISGYRCVWLCFVAIRSNVNC